MPKPGVPKGSSSRGSGAAQSSTSAHPIVDNPERLLRKNTVRTNADKEELPARSAAPPRTTAPPEGENQVELGDRPESDQMEDTEERNEPKVVVPRLDLEAITTLVVERAAQELSDRIPALVFQFLEQDAREYLDQMVLESLRDHQVMNRQEPQTGQGAHLDHPETPQVYPTVKAFQAHLPINQTGEKHSDLPRERADPPGEEGPRYVYLPEPIGEATQGTKGGDPGDRGSPSSSEDERRRRPKGKKKKTNRKKKKGRLGRSDPDASDSDTDSDSSSEEEGHRGKKKRKDPYRRSKKNRKGKPKRRGDSESDSDCETDLEALEPLNDLFTKAVDYRTYRLENRNAAYTSSVAQKITKQHKRLSFQMGDTTFSGDDPIAIIDFLQRFKIACDQNGFSEGAAMWLFQFYLKGQAATLLHSRMQGNTMAVEEDQTEMLRTYPEVVNYLLETYATDEVIQEAYAEVLSYRQRPSQPELEFAKSLFALASRCGNVFTTTRLKAMFSDNVDKSIRAQVRNHLANSPKVDYNGLARFAQALGDTHRASRQTVAPAKPLKEKPKTKRILEVEYSSEDAEPGAHFSGGAIHLVHPGSGLPPGSPSSNWTTTAPSSEHSASTPTTLVSAPAVAPHQVLSVPFGMPQGMPPGHSQSPQSHQTSFRTAVAARNPSPARTTSMALKDPTTGNLLC